MRMQKKRLLQFLPLFSLFCQKMNDLGNHNKTEIAVSSPTPRDSNFCGFSNGTGGDRGVISNGSNNRAYPQEFETAALEEMQHLTSTDLEGDAHRCIMLTNISSPKSGVDNGKGGNNNGRDILPSNGNKVKTKPCQDFDEILEIVGSEGKFQKFMLYAVLCPIVTISPFLGLSTVFMWDIPDHFCLVPGRESNMSLEEWKNITLPWEQGPDGLMRHSQCKMIDQETGNETKCQFGWVYDKTDYESTIPSEYNWVCDKDHYATDCFSWSSFGGAIGSVVFGIMADKYGRKPIFFIACFMNILFKTSSLFWAHNYLLYKTLQLLGGSAFVMFTMLALITAEVSGTNYRSWIYAVTWMIYVLGNSLIPFVAMICRDWFLFGCVAAVPGFCLFFYYPIFHESPRWLISAGKAEQAGKIILKIASTNGKKVDPDVIDRMVQELVLKVKKEKGKQNVGVWTLFSKYRIAKNTIMLTIAWTMNSLLYFGLTLNTTKMAGNKFLNYFFLSIIELPGGWLGGKLAEKTGRRWTHAGFFLLCTISCLLCAIAVTYPGQVAVTLIGALGIKFGATVTSLVAYIQAAEIFPTQLRSTGTGLISTVATSAGIVGPYLIYTGTINVAFPYALLCLCSFFGFLSSASLPETFKQPLPETIDDANKFGNGQKFWSYLPQVQEERKGQEKKGSLDT